MKRIAAGLLTVLMLLTLNSSGALAITTAEKEQSYKSALEELESYMENPEESPYSLTSIISAFESLNNYQYSRKFFYYAQVLKKIDDGDFDVKYDFYLKNLISDEKFCRYMSEELDYYALGTPDMLKTYSEGRKAEMEINLDAALECYQRCTGFFDSDVRSETLYMGGLDQAYRHADALLDQGKLAEAYMAFLECKNYLDSEEWLSFIIEKLGYNPASETPAPTKAPATPTPSVKPAATPKPAAAPKPATASTSGFDLIVLNTAGYIMFRWYTVEGADSYAIKRRDQNSSYTTIFQTSGNSYRDASVSTGSTYYYIVTAQFPNGSAADSKELSVVAERGATPAPTATPTPVPTAVPVQWTAWSEWSTTPVTASSTRQVQTSVREEKVQITMYQYSRYVYVVNGVTKYSQSKPASKYDSHIEYKNTETRLKYLRGGKFNSSGDPWYNETTYVVDTKQVTYYRYRDRL